MSVKSVRQDFVRAFNDGDLDALSACLAEDAWAEVVGAPFPREEGRATIRATSLTYLLGESLTAEERESQVLLRDREGSVDMTLRFEERDGLSLADRILRDAASHAELLPLVEFVLRELYERRTATDRLTHAAYDALGGVEGALASRAEAAFRALPGDLVFGLGVLGGLCLLGLGFPLRVGLGVCGIFILDAAHETPALAGNFGRI